MKIAVLVDADNASAKSLALTLQHIAEYGTVVIKRVYGDWSRPNLHRWKEYSNKYSLKSIQAYSYVKGKNSTDIAMIIDAMDILHQKSADAFCIVSSDCDFTGLIHRIKEDGLFTIGVGKVSACSSFKAACDLFIHEVTESKKSEQLSDSLVSQKDLLDAENLFKAEIEPLPGIKILGKIDLNKVK